MTAGVGSPRAAASGWLAGYRAARTRFPPRPAAADWPATRAGRDQVEDLLGRVPAGRHQGGRGLLLDWLEDQDGDSWQQRWLASGAEEAGPTWWQLPARRAGSRDLPGMRRFGALTVALIAVIAGDVVRPSLAWLAAAGCDAELARAMAAVRDPQGFARLAELCDHALPQFTTQIDGQDIHFIHVRSRHENALPLIITHGWPGSVIELLGAIGPLTDPAAHGGHAADAFDLVLPSLPGYGFSAEAAQTGWDPGHIAAAWAELMRRLGYERYVAQGGDQGAAVTDALGAQAPSGLAGIHLNFLRQALGNLASLPAGSAEERAAAAAINAFRTGGFGYFLEQTTRPQTIGYALLDSPVALAAWMLDHDTDSYYKIARAFTGGPPSGGLTRDHILDNITLYWLTGTGASAARSYWEGGQASAHAAGQAPPQVTLPAGFTTFPGEIFRAPRSWAEKSYPNLTYFHEADRGGHFAAWEEPELFATEIRAAFKPLR